jgi:hypothetical protein
MESLFKLKSIVSLFPAVVRCYHLTLLRIVNRPSTSIMRYETKIIHISCRGQVLSHDTSANSKSAINFYNALRNQNYPHSTNSIPRWSNNNFRASPPTSLPVRQAGTCLVLDCYGCSSISAPGHGLNKWGWTTDDAPKTDTACPSGLL